MGQTKFSRTQYLEMNIQEFLIIRSLFPFKQLLVYSENILHIIFLMINFYNQEVFETQKKIIYFQMFFANFLCFPTLTIWVSLKKKSSPGDLESNADTYPLYLQNHLIFQIFQNFNTIWISLLPISYSLTHFTAGKL